MRKALSGISVVELGGGIAPAYCGKLLADLGADVIKVEHDPDEELRAPAGDPSGGRSGLVLHLHTNKRSVLLDPQRPEDRQHLGNLLSGCDLVIESGPRGTLADWGIGPDQARRDRGLSIVHISGFGADGPYSGYRWEDIVAQAVSGAFLVQGNVGPVPLKLPRHVALYFVGHMAAVGAISAVMAAEAGQAGAFVDCSAVETLASLPYRQAFLLGYQYRDRAPSPTDTAASTPTLIPTGVFPCADGYVALMSTTQQLNEMLEVLGDADATAAFERPDAFERPETKEVLDVAVYNWLLSRTRAEATAEAQRAGWPLAGVYHAGEILEADHLHQRNYWVHTDDPGHGAVDLPGPWCRFAEGGWSLRRLAPDAGQHTEAVLGRPLAASTATAAPAPATPRPPLEGVRILDLTVVWAGPYATMLLADLGAEVIRVENPYVLPPTTKGYHPRPVLTNPGMLGSLYAPPRQGAPDRPWNRHAMNNSLARNKLSVTIDNRRPEGLELVMRLAEQSDVLIDNFKANGLERIGIDVSELQRRNPRLIIVRLPPTGLTGDWAAYTGFGAQFDALSGLSSVCGHLGSDPTTTPATTYMDAASGPAGALAVLAALRYRGATGRGQFVEMSQSENVMSHLGEMFVEQQLGLEARRLGNRHERFAPQGLYPCRGQDRWLAVTVPDESTWPRLAGAIGRPELAGDPRFADAAGRRAHHDELDRAISAWTVDQDAIEAFHLLQGAGVPAGPLLDDELLTDDPNLAARGWFRPLESGDVGVHPHPGPAFTGVPLAWRRGSPTLGEDNEYVYKKILGVSDDDYARYERDHILATDYLKPDGTPY
ncbi:MAG: CoA transferase [Actinomycetota bacterium]|nr:CoA transferase [Actinomycetota bacterium]